MNYNLTEGSGRFYRGNLHTHTTRSDGPMSLEDTVKTYKAMGYDFLAITDHRRYYAGGDVGGMLLLDGIENDINYSLGIHKCHHFVGIGSGSAEPYAHEEIQPHLPQIKQGAQAQELIDLMRRRCELVIHAHPHWSNTHWSDYSSFTGCDMVEVFNTGCDVENSNGLCDDEWHEMLNHGVKINACATDDGHHRYDMGRGWVAVYAPELSQRAIIDALKEGRFYASTGPQIHSIVCSGGEVTIECSVARKINFITTADHPAYQFALAENFSSQLTRATFKLPEGQPFFRLEVTDFSGGTAWSQPIPLK